MRVGVEQAGPLRPGHQEPLEQRGGRVPLCLAAALRNLRQRGAAHPVHDQHPRGGLDHLRDADAGVVAVREREPLLAARLVQVVELLGQPGPHLGHQRRQGQTAGHDGGGPAHRRQRAQVSRQRLPYAGVLHLHGDLPAIRPHCRVHLTERRRCGRLLLERPKAVPPQRPELGRQHRFDLGERQPGVGLLQPDEGVAPAVLRICWKQRLDGRQQLACLERAALELAEHRPGAPGVAAPQLGPYTFR